VRCYVARKKDDCHWFVWEDVPKNAAERFIRTGRGLLIE
jgi:hypothetical protein